VNANGTPVDAGSFNGAGGPHEQLQPPNWPISEGSQLGEVYRRCCTSTALVAEALAARLLSAVGAWNYPAFFDYADRWMSENDTQSVATILSQTGYDYTADWLRQRQTRSFLQGRIAQPGFVDDMWTAYRNLVIGSPPTAPTNLRITP
jgi:hypothetical protein